MAADVADDLNGLLKGEISACESGDIALTEDFNRYTKVFEYLLANDGQTDGSAQPFDDSYYDGWCISDKTNVRKPIDIRCIENGEVIWRE